jgi:putative transposase
MRVAHSNFGREFNRLKNRSGKVAEDRPKTSLIENDEHLMRVHFYVEANPIRAGLAKFENLHRYKHSSFAFYAYGRRDENSKLLTIPRWYMELGRNPGERQKKFRKLFRIYLETQNIQIDFITARYIGSLTWVSKKNEQLKILIEQNRHLKQDEIDSG